MLWGSSQFSWKCKSSKCFSLRPSPSGAEQKVLAGYADRNEGKLVPVELEGRLGARHLPLRGPGRTAPGRKEEGFLRPQQLPSQWEVATLGAPGVGQWNCSLQQPPSLAPFLLQTSGSALPRSAPPEELGCGRFRPVQRRFPTRPVLLGRELALLLLGRLHFAFYHLEYEKGVF